MTDKLNTSLRLTPEAKHLLTELAKKLGVSQAAIIEMAIRKFAQQEMTMNTYSRRQHTVEKIADLIVGRRLSDEDVDRANLAGWTIDIRFADGQYVSENNWSRVEDIHLTPEELDQAKRIAAKLEATFQS